MTVTRFIPLLAALLMQTGCSAVTANLSGMAPSQLQLAAPSNAPQLAMTLENRNIILTIAKVERQQDVEIWAVADGPQVFLREGMILGTRGFGPDLMSAHAPSAATLRSMTDHSRSYAVLDGTDTLQTETFACTAQPAPAPAPAPALTVDETCTSPQRVIRNQFSFGRSGKVVNSRQWLGPTAGYTIITEKIR